MFNNEKIKRNLNLYLCRDSAYYIFINGFIIFSILYIDEQTNISLYNNGIHEEDGGKWELVSVHKGNVYYYCCDKCENAIHFSDTNN